MTISRTPPPPNAAALRAAVAAVSAEPLQADGQPCLGADEILELLLGALPEAKRDQALEHIAACEDCRVMFAAAAQALENTGPADASVPGGVFQAGALVAQRYLVETFLARGGMGEVYAVRDQVLNERVALKTVRARFSSAKAILRLKSEALLSRRIGHPHTCRIFEFGEHRLENGEVICFLTMELVEGETLGARLRREGRLPLDQVRMLMRQLLGGLAEAHGLGIVHRDLKSDNVMLRSPPTPGLVVDAVIMDFGLALRLDTEERLTTDSQALVGSAAYMAPEQVEGERLTPSTDVYAFGIILFEMLTGQLPFRAATPASTALLRLHSPPPPPSSLRRELDPYWDEVVLGCLERSVERRFRSAREVLAALDQPRPAAAPLARSRSRPLAAALGALAVLAISVLSFYLMRAPPPPGPVETSLQSARVEPVPGPAAAAEVEPEVKPSPGALGAASPAPVTSEPGPRNGPPAPAPRKVTSAPAKKRPGTAGGVAPTWARPSAEKSAMRPRAASSAATSMPAAPTTELAEPAPSSSPPAPQPPASSPSGTPHREPAHREPAHREPAHREPAHREPAHRDPSPLEPLPLDPELPE